MGVKPDLVLIDYVDLLSSRKTNRERKDEIDDIYTCLLYTSDAADEE